MKLGIENLLSNARLKKRLKAKRIALLGHPASVDGDCRHSLDLLIEARVGKVTAAFGPQHGMRGEKQDNMIETDDYRDPQHGIPIYSLYGKIRKPTAAMIDAFDVLLVDLQDVGTRVYTFVTTLKYMMEACAREKKQVWVLDRPNPAGRGIEGTLLEPGHESFVGCAPMPMRHGLTMGELARWYVDVFGWDLDLTVVPMTGYRMGAGPDFGWPRDREWINPSPNAPQLPMARCYPGTVMLEGTTLSEGRGTTRPLEIMGAPDLPIERILATMQRVAPSWLKGCLLRPCFFEPTFHKHQGKLCAGIQIHVQGSSYTHKAFKPYRVVSMFYKAIREWNKDYPLWRDFPYEYETDRLAIDVITGGEFLRKWVDDPHAKPGDLDKRLKFEEARWLRESRKYWMYR